MTRNHKLLATLVALLLAPMALGRAAPQDRVEDAQMAIARARYGADQWPTGARLAGHDLRGLRLSRLTGEDLQFQADSGQVLRRYVNAEGRPTLLVEMLVTEDVAAAHRALLRHIAYLQSTKAVPTAAERNVRAGDIGFIGYAGPAEERVAWIAFVQGNVEVRVVDLARTGGEPTDVITAVETLSRDLSQADRLPEGPLPRPRVAQFTAEQAECVMGDQVPLALALEEAGPAVVETDFQVRGKGQGYVERGADGRFAFHATNAGAVTLVVHVLGRNGTVGSAELDLEVGSGQ